jgi:hypothetical protein
VRAQADEELQRGLDVVSRAIGESIDGLAGRDLDDLRTEVRFLQSRHPVRNPQLIHGARGRRLAVAPHHVVQNAVAV